MLAVLDFRRAPGHRQRLDLHHFLGILRSVVDDKEDSVAFGQQMVLARRDGRRKSRNGQVI